MNVKIVQQIPIASVLEASTLYLVQKEEGFEIHITDDNKAIKKLLSIPDAPNDGKEYLRFNNTWKAFTGWQFRQLSDTEHLDDIKYPGLFGQYNSGAVTIARGFPNDEARGGHILSLPMTLNPSTRTLFHVYFSAGTKNAGDYTNVARIYMRAFVNNERWLPWREFDGGKVHTLTDAVQNISKAFKGFPTNDSTFVIDKATTVTVPKNYGIIKYVKNTDENLTFSPASGVNIIGDKVVTAPVGTLVHLICNGTTAFICYNTVDTDNFIQKKNETNLMLANGNTLSRDAYHWVVPNNKHFLQADGTKVNPNTLYKSQETEELQNTQVYSTDKLNLDSGTYRVNHGSSFSEILVNFNMRKGSASALQFKKSYQDGSRLSIRNYIDDNTPTSWRELAYASELVAYGETKSGANVVIHNWETKNTFFLTGSGNMSVDVSSLQDGRIAAFKKCYNGGVITFVCRNKQIILKGATVFNGAEGSNAVVSIVGGKCYIDLNNY